MNEDEEKKKVEKKVVSAKEEKKKRDKQMKNFYICLTIQFQNRMVLKTICQLPTNPIDVIFHFFW